MRFPDIKFFFFYGLYNNSYHLSGVMVSVLGSQPQNLAFKSSARQFWLVPFPSVAYVGSPL